MKLLIVNAVGEFSFIQDRNCKNWWLANCQRPELYQVKTKRVSWQVLDSCTALFISQIQAAQILFLGGGPGLHIGL